ncbi:MAG TPA: PAS domain S-box protein [Methanospirillum sp.]|uniref:PAS domain-containing protein n=1 Tax=Methanospirillum sp. TaxID=45200 RepID=UPI002C545C02|nr:PAS domain S-box protein [Methanospirillum sp.]HOJ95498.1 PAS domain S-box protein [Methanospirillum sp.]HPP77227.1 PAS domain S-box protein [Methanospirillum sp.]
MQENRGKETDPLIGAFLISVLFALILFPYWWLADQWSATVIPDPSTHFTFSSTTFLLILALIDSAFLIRYYQIRQKNDLANAVAQIQKGAENYRLLIENAPFPIVITKYSDNTIIVINKKAAELFSIDPSEKTGKPVSFQFIGQENQKQIRDTLTVHEHLHGYEVAFFRKTGEKVYASLSADIIEYMNEKAIFTAFVDISERVALEQEIIRREEKFSVVFHEVPNPLMILSEDGIIHDVNYGFEQFFNMKKDDVVSFSIHDLPFFAALNPDLTLPVVEQKKIQDYELTLPGGEKRFVILHYRHIRIGEEKHILVLIQDVDTIKRIQNAITQANNQLSILNSVTRHDILNRVMAVISYCDLLRHSITHNPELSWLDTIEKAGYDIQTLIEFTRQYQDLGIHPPEWQRIERIMKNRSIQTLLTGISVILPDEPYEIYADTMFEKVLYNLIENSIRHGEKVTEITLSYEKRGPDLILRYTDNGVGIPDEDKSKIFRKGFGKNTGLGLFLIREILSLTGISITEHGMYKSGVIFDMLIPAGSYRISPENTDQVQP